MNVDALPFDPLMTLTPWTQEPTDCGPISSAESQIGRLRKEQAKLIEDWGPELDTRTVIAPES